MAIKKNKILLRDKSFSLKNEMDNFFECWYDEDDFIIDRCDCSGCNDYWGGQCEYEGTWEYLDDISLDFNNKPLLGKLVDMNSIYSIEILREKKIDQIFGLYRCEYKPTLREIFPKKIL